MRSKVASRVAMLIIVVSVVFGCQMHMGSINVAEQECKGIYWQVGDTTGPCDMNGGVISPPGASLIGGAGEGLVQATLSLFGREPIVIEHRTEAPTMNVLPYTYNTDSMYIETDGLSN